MRWWAFGILWGLVAINSFAQTQLTVPLYRTDDAKKSIGEVVFQSSPYGVLIMPQVTLTPGGAHGFHIHEKPSCADAGKASGGHLNPYHESHAGPYAWKSHLGDLPVIVVQSNGQIAPMLAPKIQFLSQLAGHAVVIHEHGDNYANKPSPEGGGGAPIACGVIPAVGKE